MDLKEITMPVLNIYAKHDHLVPPESCEQFIDKIGSVNKENLCLDTGHIGIYVSAKMQPEFGPKIVQWLAAREAQSDLYGRFQTKKAHNSRRVSEFEKTKSRRPAKGKYIEDSIEAKSVNLLVPVGQFTQITLYLQSSLSTYLSLNASSAR